MTIELDGAAGEGGGQISRIRARRAKPGLMRQHLACVHAAQAVSGARIEGAELGSQWLHFAPGQVCPGEHAFAVGTAGSCTLVLQTVLRALMLADAPSRLCLSDGTHNPMAPPYPFIERSFAPLLRRLGVGIDLTLLRHGFYPAGGGDIEATVYPACTGLHRPTAVRSARARPPAPSLRRMPHARRVPPRRHPRARHARPRAGLVR